MTANPPVALITGSARRIGAAIARHLHSAGYDLALHYRDSSEEMQAWLPNWSPGAPKAC